MPKKTKREKIIAEYRRKLQKIPTPSVMTKTVSENQIKPPIATGEYQFQATAKTLKANSAPAVALADFPVIKKDLITTVALAAIIIVSEFLLAWRLRL